MDGQAGLWKSDTDSTSSFHSGSCGNSCDTVQRCPGSGDSINAAPYSS